MKRWMAILMLSICWPTHAAAGGPEKNPLSPWFLSDADRRWHVDGLVGVELEPDYVGSGLPPALLEQLRSTGPQPDAGIGLATVQRICRRFEWRFDVECPPGTIATIGWPERSR